MDIKLIIRSINSYADGLRIFNDLELPASVEVREGMKQATTFTITYPEDICDGDFKKIAQKVFDPFSELESWYVMVDNEHSLVRVLAQGRQTRYGKRLEVSQLVITGADNSIRFGWVSEKKNWGPRIDREEIMAILGSTRVTKDKKEISVNNYEFDEYHIMGKKYQAGGQEIIDKPVESDEHRDEKSVAVPDPVAEEDFLSFTSDMLQSQDDLAFLKSLADQKGMHFWISYEGDKEIVHFEKIPLWQISKRELMCPDAITLHMNKEFSDIDEFSISWDCDRPTSVSSEVTNRKTGEASKNKIAKAEQSKLGNVLLSDMSGYVIEAFHSIPAGDEKEANERTNAALNEAEWFIKASCSTNYEKLCKNESIQSGNFTHVFHAHKLVNIDGIGSRHRGTYLISGVKHSMSAGSYKLQVELRRNAWVYPSGEYDVSE